MTAFEIISIFMGILGLMISSCTLLVALLAFLGNKKRKKNKRKE